jgi:hypothetical protein
MIVVRMGFSGGTTANEAHPARHTRIPNEFRSEKIPATHLSVDDELEE